jgi:hypothetical protein
MKNKKTKKIFQIYGLSRSGIHGITYWLIGHCTSSDLFRKIQFQNKNENIEKPNVFFTKENHILSYDNYPKGIENNIDLKNILIIRDPYNYFSSVFKKGYIIPIIKKINNELNLEPELKKFFSEKVMKNPDKFKFEILKQLWKMYAYEALNETNFLFNKIVIKYNTWFENEEYRKSISQKLGWKYSEKNLNHVSSCGDGSSFDHQDYNGKAQQMKTTERFKIYQNQIWFQNLLMQDNEIKKLSKKLFGFDL